jgi:hypothetical protein
VEAETWNRDAIALNRESKEVLEKAKQLAAEMLEELREKLMTHFESEIERSSLEAMLKGLELALGIVPDWLKKEGASEIAKKYVKNLEKMAKAS